MKKTISTILYLFFVSTFTFSQSPYNLIYDTNQSQYFGAENIATFHSFIYRGFDKFIPHRLSDEKTFLKKTVGIGYRFAKLSLVDFQIDFLLALTQHEVFGHGSRMRELGYIDIHYNLSPLPPFGRGGSYASADYPIDFIGTKYQRMAISFSGNEGNLVLSENLEERMLMKNNIHYREALLFWTSRNNLLAYSISTLFLNDEGDILSYIKILNPGNEIKYDDKKLFLHNLTAVLNPIQLYSVWTMTNTYLLKGESRLEKFPTFKIKEYQYVPSINFNLTPFGSEFLINQYLIKNNRLLRAQIRIGENTFNNFYGGGIKCINLIRKLIFGASPNLNSAVSH